MLVALFDTVKATKENEVQHFYFEEHKVILNEDLCVSSIAYGFHKEVIIQDFSLQYNTVYHYVKRRRWLDKYAMEVVQRDWSLVAQGTRITDEFAVFLKRGANTKAIDCITIGGIYNINGKTTAAIQSSSK